MTTTLRIDDDLKRDCDKVFEELGLNMTSALTVFLKQVVRTRTIPFIIGDERANNVVFTVTNMMGQTVSVIELGSRTRGEYKYEWKPAASMATGIYTVSMQVNGRNVQRAKVVYVN
jgi:addiction module RelB/DinJ family antitoxin